MVPVRPASYPEIHITLGGTKVGTKQTNRLNALAVKNARAPGRYPDGDGLFLQVSNASTKSWIYRYSAPSGKRREMGLGAYPAVELADARRLAKEARLLVLQGRDPIDERNGRRTQERTKLRLTKSFRECAIECHRTKAVEFSNPKHAQQWINTLTTYAFPIIGALPVDAVSKADIVAVLRPIWTDKPETGSRLLQRIRTVLAWACAHDYRKETDAHLWDHVRQALPSTRKIKRVRHHLACPVQELPALIKKIRASGSAEIVRLALEFVVLTAARSGEVREAKWSEIDWESKRWIVPAHRMKARVEHRVPLSPQALTLLQRAKARRQSVDLIFPSPQGKVMSSTTIALPLNGVQVTVHGFRSTFRDWASEMTSFPREVAEAALAHTVRDKTEAAYFRSDLFDKRRQMMDAWGAFCEAAPAACTEPQGETVVPLPKAA